MSALHFGALIFLAWIRALRCCRKAFFIFHKVIPGKMQMNGGFGGYFSGCFHKIVYLSTISTVKTVHNVDKCKILACREIGIFLIIVDNFTYEKINSRESIFNLFLIKYSYNSSLSKRNEEVMFYIWQCQKESSFG